MVGPQTAYRSHDDRALVEELEERLGRARTREARSARLFWRGTLRSLVPLAIAAAAVFVAPLASYGVSPHGRWMISTLAWIVFAFAGGFTALMRRRLDRPCGVPRPPRPVRIAQVVLLATVVTCGGLFVSELLAPDWYGIAKPGAAQI